MKYEPRSTGKALLAFATLALARAASAAYTLTIIDPVDGGSSTACAISPLGKVTGAGTYTTSTPYQTHINNYAYVWTPTVANGTVKSSFVSLGSCDPASGTIGDYTSTEGRGINDNGLVTGFQSWTAIEAGFYWNGSSMIRLPRFTQNTSEGKDLRATAINASGLATGGSSYPWINHNYDNQGLPYGSPTVWPAAYLYGGSGGLSAIDPISSAPESIAYGINDLGDTTGYWRTAMSGVPWTAALWKGTTRYALNVSSYAWSQGTAISSLGDIVGIGQTQVGGGRTGFVWRPTVSNGTTGAVVAYLTEANGAETLPYSVNASATVVGNAYKNVNGSVTQYAFIWKPSFGGTQVQDLNTVTAPSVPGATSVHLDSAMGINNFGQIVGTCTITTVTSGGGGPRGGYPGGTTTTTKQRGYILTPS